MRPFPPGIPIGDVPEAEREYALALHRMVSQLDSLCTEFEAALALFDLTESDEGKKYKFWFNWQFIAANAAASAVYKFDEAMEHIKINLNGCRSIARKIDAPRRRNATKAFSNYFPGFEGVRHSGQHSGLYGSPAKIAEQASPGSVLTINCLSGRKLETDYDGQTASLEISQDTLVKLRKVRNLYWEAFYPVDPFSAALNSSLAQFMDDP